MVKVKDVVFIERVNFQFYRLDSHGLLHDLVDGSDTLLRLSILSIRFRGSASAHPSPYTPTPSPLSILSIRFPRAQD